MKSNSIPTTFSRAVTLPSLIIILAISIYCGFFPEKANTTLSAIQSFIVLRLGWSYVFMFAFFITFLLVVAFSKMGSVKLGSDYTQPKYGFFTWLAMLFAAGMGVGLMFFGVAESISHFASPALPNLSDVERAKYAQAYSVFHWGIHGWAVYALVALALAYFRFRYKLPLAIRSAFYPILKEKIYGRAGDVIDVFALCNTVFGIATTIGFGVMQLNAGLQSLGILQKTDFTYQVVIVVVILAMALASAVSGLDQGIKRLSQGNMLLAIGFMCFILILGPTSYIIGIISEGFGFYLSRLAELTFNTYAYEPESQKWFADWTIFYWAWWIAWAPFVGIFIARISKGRTIREFIIGVIFIPSLFNFIWMSIFGGAAIWVDQHEAAGALSAMASEVEGLLFAFLHFFPFTKVLNAMAILMITIFFVTSADSGILVINSIASTGKSESYKWQSFFWAILLALLSIAMLRSGGLKAVQTVTLVAALPFGIILIMICCCLWIGLKTDVLFHGQEVAHGSLNWQGKGWKDRLRKILSVPQKQDTERFMSVEVEGAFAELQKEFSENGIEAEINRGMKGKGDFVELRIPYDKLKSFTYGVFAEPKEVSEYLQDEENAPYAGTGVSFVPLTYFNDGRTGYDIEYMSREEIIADVLREYERFLALASNKATQLMAMDQNAHELAEEKS